ncbi:MAG: c-type cytochrome, partial [Gammaproteobacteria bacterium]
RHQNGMQKSMWGINMNGMICKKLILVMLLMPFVSNTLLASNTGNGQKIYQQHCVKCHGVNGKSVMAGAAEFNRGEGLFQSDHGLLERIQSGNNACPAYRGILTEQKIFDVIAYIRTLYW